MVKKIQFLPQLLTIKGYSEAQDRISRDVDRQNQLFDELVAEVNKGGFDLADSEKIEKRFGPPVFKRQAEYQGRTLAQWLYRYAKDFDGDKVYMYFDEQGQLIDLDYVKGSKTED